MNSITRKEGITDARELGMPKYIILGVQHLFAMFGATILVPVLTGLSVLLGVLVSYLTAIAMGEVDCHRFEIWC